MLAAGEGVEELCIVKPLLVLTKPGTSVTELEDDVDPVTFFLTPPTAKLFDALAGKTDIVAPWLCNNCCNKRNQKMSMKHESLGKIIDSTW